jgi:hypothetical protein
MPYKDKCVSTCSQFPKQECNPPRCNYISGPKHKFCRLSHKYKMQKPNCNVTRRIKKGEQQEKARAKIGKMIEKSGKFLQMICSDSNVCIAFGKRKKEIRDYFNGFTGFENVSGDVKRLGAVSANGFVRLITYEKYRYKAHAILKSSQKTSADNLVYEYLVGDRFINRIMDRFPCFVETYGKYFYKNNESWFSAQDQVTPKYSLKNLKLEETIDWSRSCQLSKWAAILIEQIADAVSLSDMLRNKERIIYIVNNPILLHILFIIYHALAKLSKQFTHYDLHLGNIMLYKPSETKYIKYIYHDATGGSPLEFNCQYVPKIIDYGRSFFDNGNLNSRKIYDRLCKEKDCEPRCGEQFGFEWLDPIPSYHISSSKKNESHDLRALNDLNDILQYYITTKSNEYNNLSKCGKELMTVANKVQYGIDLPPQFREYGTKENLKNVQTKIYNVTSAYKQLKNIIEKTKGADGTDLFSKPEDCLGTLHVYDDAPMKFEIAK